MQQIAASYPARECFLTEFTLDPPAATSDDAGAAGRDDDYLVLSTIHSAKGLEWHAVHILNVVDGCITSDMAAGTRDELDEERRLLGVAMTRARDQLHLLVPQRFYVHAQPGHGNRHVYASRSRFITAAVARQFAPMTWPMAPPEPAIALADTEEPRCPLDLAARVRALWDRPASLGRRTGSLPALGAHKGAGGTAARRGHQQPAPPLRVVRRPFSARRDRFAAWRAIRDAGPGRRRPREP